MNKIVRAHKFEHFNQMNICNSSKFIQLLSLFNLVFFNTHEHITLYPFCKFTNICGF
jgi:hypothetical protein